MTSLLLFLVLPAQAQWTLTDATGTNIVDALGGQITYGGSIMIPLVVGILGIALMVGLYKRFASKAGVRT